MKDEKGQSLFEFLIFVPFLVMLFASLVKIQGAINASINQQKSARGYFFNLLRHNSMFPDRGEVKTIFDNGSIQTIGMSVIGWRDYSKGGDDGEGSKNPVSSCFKLVGVSNSSANEECEDSVEATKTELRNIRVYTAFGLCSANYSNDNGLISYRPDVSGRSNACKNE